MIHAHVQYIMCLHNVSLQRDIANYWPGMHNTALLFFCFFFQFHVNLNCFDRFHLYKNNAKEKLLSCNCNIFIMHMISLPFVWSSLDRYFHFYYFISTMICLCDHKVSAIMWTNMILLYNVLFNSWYILNVVIHLLVSCWQCR